MGSAAVGAPAAAGASGSATARWAVGERRAPASRRDAALVRIAASEAHPLARTSGEKAADVAELKAAKESKQEGRQGLVVLGDGDMDPLGVLSASAPAESERERARTATAGALDDGLATVRKRWKAHTERVMAKFAEHTFKIKASMLETGDLEREISLDSNRTMNSSGQQPLAPDTVDGVNVLRKSRERLEELEIKQFEQQQGAGGGSTASSRGDRTLELSQREYVARVKRMETQMRAAWGRDQKVLALRLAIKCVKLLGDTTTAPQLYPCVFVLVSDALDAFGELVFNRIATRASEDESGQPLPRTLPDNFTSSDVNVHAKETCRNWFYKTACIRELLPRIYIEIALLRCYRFLCDGEYPQIVARLSNMIKGIADPLVALYAWLYLALASSDLLTASNSISSITNPSATGGDVVVGSLSNFFFIFNQFRSTRNQLDTYLSTQNMLIDDYLALQSPAIEWLMHCAAVNASECSPAAALSMLLHGNPPRSAKREAFEQLADQFGRFSQCAMVLSHLLERFDAEECYGDNPSRVLELIRSSRASPAYSHGHLYSVLALQLSNCAALLGGEDDNSDANYRSWQLQQRLAFLNELWDCVTTKSDRIVGAERQLEMYMECAAATMKLVVVHYSPREALLLLRDAVRHVNAATQQELTPRTFNLLGALIENVVVGAQRRFAFFRKIVPSSEFLSLLGMFGRDASVGVARQVLRAFVRNTDAKLADSMQHHRLAVVGPEAVIAHTLFVLCCRIHDSLDSLHATRAAREDAARDICAFISRLGSVSDIPTADDGQRAREHEQSALLELFVDCRRAFYKLELVQATLVSRVLSLAVSIHFDSQRSASRRSGKLRELIKSCLAFAHITIPSIAVPSSAMVSTVAPFVQNLENQKQPWLVRIELLVQTANVALMTGCLPQLDAAAKAAIVALAELSLENDVLSASRSGQRQTQVGESGGLYGFQRALEELQGVISSLTSVLIYTPSLTDDDAFYFVRALRRATLERLLVVPTGGALLSNQQVTEAIAIAVTRVRVQLAILQLLVLWGQRKLPSMCKLSTSSAFSIDANDVLYGGDAAFEQQVVIEFSGGVDAIVREIEGIGSLGGVGDGTAHAKAVVATQAELMLDFINFVVPVVEYEPPANALVAQVVEREGGRRQSSGSRSGAVLVRKCWQYANERLDALEQLDGGTLKRATPTSKQEAISESNCSWLQSYREVTRVFVAEVANERRKLIVGPSSSQSALQALFDTL